MGAIDIPRNPDATVAHNTFIIAEGADPLRLDRADGTASVEDNIFINAGSAPKHTDWHPEGARITYSGNVTIGFADQPSDIGAQHGEPRAPINDRKGTIAADAPDDLDRTDRISLQYCHFHATA